MTAYSNYDIGQAIVNEAAYRDMLDYFDLKQQDLTRAQSMIFKEMHILLTSCKEAIIQDRKKIKEITARLKKHSDLFRGILHGITDAITPL